ncbi:hypothetical protein JCM24511_08655 [Saitozyma sp. JCM 24511]|nr:hypothetical protein JCM24511_08655 [Saitozyma sp. JCM 24511]
MAETTHAGPSDHSTSSSGATILTHLSALLPTSSTTQPYLHPYAPGAFQSGYGWKGKARELYPSAEEQLRLIRDISAAVDGARTVLAKKDGDWAKLSRALREVVTHQNALLPLETSLLTCSSSLASALAPPLPSHLVSLTPVELLQALAKELDIQTYLEDSQFGLLKTTLTLAGNCFVIDVDLETDPSPGEDADVDLEAEAEGADGVDGAASMSEAGRAEGEARGKVRLSKLGVNHVTPGGGTGKSEHIAKVLKGGMVAYVEEWNKRVDGSDAGIRAERLEERIGRVKAMLEEVKVMDEMGNGAQETAAEVGTGSSESRKDLFADLELVAKTLDEWIKGEDSITVRPSDAASIFPSFLILPPTLSPVPVLRIRPARISESVPPPPSATSEGGADVTMEEATWLSAEWVLEVVSTNEANGLGMVVRRSCFAPGSNGLAVGTWDGAAKVENMLYHDASSYPSGTPGPFPYTADFAHLSSAEAQTSKAPALEQHWSMAQPGPDAYVLGRVGLPSSPEGLRNVVEALRKQAMLNCLFSEVFRPSNLTNPEASGEQYDGADDDWEHLMAEPTAIPLTVTQQEASLRITLPAPHIDAGSNPPIVTLEVTPSGAGARGVEVEVVFSTSASSGNGMVSDEQERAVREALEAVKEKGSLVELVRSLDRALRLP